MEKIKSILFLVFIFAFLAVGIAIWFVPPPIRVFTKVIADFLCIGMAGVLYQIKIADY